MKYREYKFLKKLYEKDPKIGKNQKYKPYFIDDIEDKNFSKDDIIAICEEYPEYVNIVKNKEEYGGYIHCIGITCRGVSAFKHYKQELILGWMKNLVIPAMVSIIC